MESTNAVKVVIQLLGILQVPQDLADDSDQADLGVGRFPPGQVVHTELLVKLVEFLNILAELEWVTGHYLGFWGNKMKIYSEDGTNLELSFLVLKWEN